MKSEEIIMLVFVGFLVTGVPLMLWMIHREQQQEDRETRRKK